MSILSPKSGNKNQRIEEGGVRAAAELIVWGNWRDRLRPASFRGAKFHLLTSGVEGGRRTVLHQYPFSEVPYLEDMGSEAGVFHISGYIVQNYDNDFDYFDERDALIAALDAYGSGTLVHPFYDELNVGLLGKYKVDESFAEGGVARFTMTFVDAGQSAQPTAVVDQEGAADSLADDVGDELEQELADSWLTEAVNYMVGKYDDAKSLFDKVYSTFTAIQTEVIADISQVQTAVAVISGTAQRIINFPLELAAAIKNTLRTYTNFIPNMSKYNTSHVKAVLSLKTFGDDLPIIPATTDTRAAQLVSRNALIGAVRVGSLAEAVRLAAYSDYASYEDAFAMLMDLMTAADDTLDWIGSNSKDDVLFDLVKTMKPFIAQMMLAKGANLPVVRDYALTGDVNPSVKIAYGVYKDIGREQEIIDRNPAAMLHPGFPTAGGSLKVLSE